MTKDSSPSSVRIPRELDKDLALISSVESVSISALIVEGLQRVIEDRRNNPEFMAKFEALGEQLTQFNAVEPTIRG